MLAFLLLVYWKSLTARTVAVLRKQSCMAVTETTVDSDDTNCTECMHPTIPWNNASGLPPWGSYF